MKKDEVYFAAEGHTSTSANYLCNLAKEKYTQIEAEINNLSFVTVEMGLIDGPKQLVKKGNDSVSLESIQTKLNRIAQLKSLCSWFREALKARDRMIKEVGEKGIYQWAEMQGIALPTKPMKKTITEDDYWAEQSVRDRQTYLELETKAAVYGQIVHPNGSLANARKDAINCQIQPIDVEKNGRDTILWTKQTTIDPEAIEAKFFELQQKQREFQASLNGLKHKCEVWVSQQTDAENTRFLAEYDAYNRQLEELNTLYLDWRRKETERISALKIRVPEHLAATVAEVQNFGK